MAEKDPAKARRNIYFCVMNKKVKNSFYYFKKLYQESKFDALLKEKEATYWLKLRSIARKPLMLEFCNLCGINSDNIKSPKLFEYIYKKKPNQKLLNTFIVNKYQKDREDRKSEEAKLISELYKMQIFDWGGLYQNNLERTIVDNYIKKIKNFTLLSKKIENEIHQSMRSYVFASWFNHWTSILIEDIFKDHRKVIPTVGLIKKVDFFINNIPFDLKVTYFPDGFMQMKRKDLGLQTELQELKNFAVKKRIEYDRAQKDKVIFTELISRFKESVDPEIKKFWRQFNNTRKDIIKNATVKPSALIRWLYEKQGERRFDAANRLFLILIDEENLEESWKMKRNIDFLKKRINSYLNKIDLQKINQSKVVFKWKDEQQYSALSDVLFINKK